MPSPPEDTPSPVVDASHGAVSGGPGGAAAEPAGLLPRGDRRQRPTPRLSRYSFRGGRRLGPRRAEERTSAFVDVYRPRLLAAILWVALMNVADSFFTLVHLQGGGIELNPFADMLLLTGRSGFVLWKSTLIGAALLVLCVHKNFPLARIGLWVAAGAYTLLFGYHLSLFLV